MAMYCIATITLILVLISFLITMRLLLMAIVSMVISISFIILEIIGDVSIQEINDLYKNLKPKCINQWPLYLSNTHLSILSLKYTKQNLYSYCIYIHMFVARRINYQIIIKSLNFLFKV